MRHLVLLSSLFATLAICLFACKSNRQENSSQPSTPSHQSTNSQNLSQQSQASSPPSQPFIEPAKPFKLYYRYQGSIGDNQPITMEMTIRNEGGGTYTFGSYTYDKTGKTQRFWGKLGDSDFAFELSDAEGGPERFSGRFTSYESFEGTWTKDRIDSSFDTSTETRKVTKTRLSQPFRVDCSTAEWLPVRFEFHTRENDSTARRKIAEGRLEEAYDSSPSRLSFTLLQVDHPNKVISATLNRSITRSMLDFYGRGEGRNHPESRVSLASALKDFDRLWREWHGEFFDIEFICDVKANEKGFLSVQFEISSYAGGAHPSYDYTYATFDTGTGRKLSLANLLVPGYEKELGYLADSPFCPWEPGSDITCPTKDLVKNGFALMRDGILFRPEIGGYQKDVLIPYENIAKLIKPHALLARFVRR